MIDRAWAERYAREWAANWHAKDLDQILSHYAAEIVFHSPRISAVLGKEQTSVSGLPELRNYWLKALERAKEIRFDVEDIGVGSNALTILYRNQRGDHVAETLVFGEDHKVVEGIVTYLGS